MKRYPKTIATTLCVIGILILTLDAKSCIAACQESIQLCIQVLIPSLFPFFVLANYLSSAIDSCRFSKLEKALHIPQGTGIVFLLGLLGGYPSGAQFISNLYNNKQISKNSAHDLLQFCNNAGPAFILGMSAVLFSSPSIGWLLWMIHVAAAIFTGLMLCANNPSYIVAVKHNPISLSDCLNRSIQTMSCICGWVVLLRTLVCVAYDKIFPALPAWFRACILGFAELSNGIISLRSIQTESIRFILFSIFIGFGGMCVVMQTSNIINGLKIKYYLKGKTMQCAFSILLSVPVSYLLYEQPIETYMALILMGCSILWILAFLILNKGKKCCNILSKRRLCRV